MSLSELLNKGLVKKAGPDALKAKELLAKAEKDIKAAGDNQKDGNHDWALAIAYNSMLSAGRALMTLKGYVPVSEAHHLAVVQFCAAVLPAESSGLVNTFNKFRVRRHDVIYGESDSVGKDEAGRAVESAKMFLKKIREKTG